MDRGESLDRAEGSSVGFCGDSEGACTAQGCRAIGDRAVKVTCEPLSDVIQGAVRSTAAFDDDLGIGLPKGRVRTNPGRDGLSFISHLLRPARWHLERNAKRGVTGQIIVSRLEAAHF